MKTKRDIYKWLAGLVTCMLALLVLAYAALPLESSTSDNSPTGHTVPNFDHIIVVTFENKEFKKVIGNPYMPTFNSYARKYTLLTEFYAEAHPSLPNYLAMIGGDTFNIETDCKDCFINAPSLPDLIESSGRTWKTYQEDMQSPCGLDSENQSAYVQKHNPFVYFDAIRLDSERCRKSVVPLADLQPDIDAGRLPNFIFITPNMCNNAHDCKLIVTDAWIRSLLKRLIPALEKKSSNYLIVLNWDEGQDNGSCCGLPEIAGGRIAVVLISPFVKNHFQDSTPYTHYSLLKTISDAWHLPYLGHARDEDTTLILAPWK